MQLTYTKKGLEIRHPSGAVQILSIKDLTRLKEEQIKRTSESNAEIARINAHITEVNKTVSDG